MEYPKRSVNGDAGEYLVAYTITRKFGWPCRLYGVDLGVDAEMEVISEDGASTGDIIKIQVKAVDNIKGKDSIAIYVDDRHIDYWKRFCIPVIICCVELSTENIYWKQITATEAFQSGGKSKKVNFCKEHDLLTVKSKEILCGLVSPEESKNIYHLFEELKERIKKLPQGSREYYDFDALAEMDKHCQNVQEVISRLEPLIAHFPWRISSLAHAEYSFYKDIFQNTRTEMSYYHQVLVNGG